MTIGIYCIEHIESGKKYIGKSTNIEKRLSKHKSYLTRSEIVKGQTNQHLYAAVRKYGWSAFKTYVLEETELDESTLKDRELYWIDTYRCIDRDFGYNLRRDSSTKMIVHEETKERLKTSHLGKKHSQKTKDKLSVDRSGAGNPMFGKQITDKHRENLRKSAKDRVFSDTHRKNLGLATKGRVVTDHTKEKQSLARSRYNYEQYTASGELLKIWSSLREIEITLGMNGSNVCAASTGIAKTYKGFVWKRTPKPVDSYQNQCIIPISN